VRWNALITDRGHEGGRNTGLFSAWAERLGAEKHVGPNRDTFVHGWPFATPNGWPAKKTGTLHRCKHAGLFLVVDKFTPRNCEITPGLPNTLTITTNPGHWN